MGGRLAPAPQFRTPWAGRVLIFFYLHSTILIITNFRIWTDFSRDFFHESLYLKDLFDCSILATQEL